MVLAVPLMLSKIVSTSTCMPRLHSACSKRSSTYSLTMPCVFSCMCECASVHVCVRLLPLTLGKCMSSIMRMARPCRYLTAPTISATTPHPFSVADVEPAPADLSDSSHQISTVHAKVSGGWTAALRHHALTKPHEPLPLRVRIVCKLRFVMQS